MPPITSPLSALRFSGRLMVIQNACPRFSWFTLLSVMALPACWCRTAICGKSSNGRKSDFAELDPPSMPEFRCRRENPEGPRHVAKEPRIAEKRPDQGTLCCTSECGNYTSMEAAGRGEAFMKANHVGTMRFGGFPPLSATRLGSLRAAAIAMALLALPLCPSEVHAAPATSGAHVYLVRGFLNI